MTPLGNGRSHWIAKGPAGMRVEWDAEIINEEENRVIGWRSLEHADVVSAGSVNFRECDGGTEIVVRLQYSPPAGRMGALIAKLFGEEPSQQIQEDLHRMKQCLEMGDAATGDAAAATPGRPRSRRPAPDPAERPGVGSAAVRRRVRRRPLAGGEVANQAWQGDEREIRSALEATTRRESCRDGDCQRHGARRARRTAR